MLIINYSFGKYSRGLQWKRNGVFADIMRLETTLVFILLIESRLKGQILLACFQEMH